MVHESHRADGPSSGTPVAIPSLGPSDTAASMHEVSGRQRRKPFRTRYVLYALLIVLLGISAPYGWQLWQYYRTHESTDDAYVVGGTVRDRLLGRDVTDLDLVVPREALTVSRQLADELGGAFYALDVVRETGRVVLPDRTVVDVALRRDDLHAEDVRGRDAVGEAVKAARILGNVPADRACRHARRVRNVVQSVLLDGRGNLGDAHWSALESEHQLRRFDQRRRSRTCRCR